MIMTCLGMDLFCFLLLFFGGGEFVELIESAGFYLSLNLEYFQS